MTTGVAPIDEEEEAAAGLDRISPGDCVESDSGFSKGRHPGNKRTNTRIRLLFTKTPGKDLKSPREIATGMPGWPGTKMAV